MREAWPASSAASLSASKTAHSRSAVTAGCSSPWAARTSSATSAGTSKRSRSAKGWAAQASGRRVRMVSFMVRLHGNTSRGVPRRGRTGREGISRSRAWTGPAGKSLAATGRRGSGSGRGAIAARSAGADYRQGPTYKTFGSGLKNVCPCTSRHTAIRKNIDMIRKKGNPGPASKPSVQPTGYMAFFLHPCFPRARPGLRMAVRPGDRRSCPLTKSYQQVISSIRAGVDQLVEYKLPKLGVASSIVVARSSFQASDEPGLFQLDATRWTSGSGSTFFLLDTPQVTLSLILWIKRNAHDASLNCSPRFWPRRALCRGDRHLLRRSPRTVAYLHRRVPRGPGTSGERPGKRPGAVWTTAPRSAGMSEISWKSRTSCPAPYVLDVSSPGIERRFFAPGQLAGYVGREIEVTLVTPARGAQISRLLIGPTETLSP